MDRLPKDVISIVDRLLSDYDYTALKAEYYFIWCSGAGKFCWYDTDVCFSTCGYGHLRRVANWRTIIDLYPSRVNRWKIYNMYTGRFTGETIKNY